MFADMHANSVAEPQVKKHLTAEERAMRRAEMARRRKNLSEKRNEEEKVCIWSTLSESSSFYSTDNRRWIPLTDS